MKNYKQKMLLSAFIAYIVLICLIFFLRNRTVAARVNLIPFSTLREYFSRLAVDNINADIVVKGTLGNIALMLPLGFFAALFSGAREKSGKICLVIALAFIAAAELLQYALRIGQFDIDTVMLRFVGVLLGYCVCRLAAAFIDRLGRRAARA